MGVPVAPVSLQDLEGIVGAGHARESGPGDAIDGVPAHFVVEPGSVQEASELMRLAEEAGLAVSPRGAGTRLGLGNAPERVDLILSTARLNRVLEHAAGDLVVAVEAGAPLREVQRTVAGAGQMLALDPPDGSGTLGGIIATNDSGPRRLRYGTVRDLLIGITIVLPDGTVARAGGKVVKNVAGYDLMKLFTGSLGTLGLVAEAIFRLHPLPTAQRTVTVPLENPEAAAEVVQAYFHSPLVPTALELAWSGAQGTLLASFEGVERSVEAQAERAVGLARREARVLPENEAAEAWRRVAALPEGDAVLKLSCVPTAVAQVLREVTSRAERDGLKSLMVGRAGVAVLLAGLSGPEEALRALIPELRELAVAGGGSLVVLQAPRGVKRAVDAWGPVGDALPLMQRVKARFDPSGIMNPGRFVGGI